MADIITTEFIRTFMDANTTAAARAAIEVNFSAPGTIGDVTPGAATFTQIIGTGATHGLNIAAGLTPVTELEVDSTRTNSPRGIMSAQFNTGVDGARLHLRKARGTRAAPVVIVSGDNLGRMVGSGWDGANYLEMAGIIFGTVGTIAANRIPTTITLQVATDAATSVLTTTALFSGSGGIALTAVGTNQSITLTPSGTANTVFGAGSLQINNAQYLFGKIAAGSVRALIGSTAGDRIEVGTGSSWSSIDFLPGTAVKARLMASGNLLLGGNVTDRTSTLQLSASGLGTTNVSGIDMGGDIFFFRTGTNTAQISASGGLAFSGPVRLANAYVAGVQVPTGYITLQDSTGTTYKVSVNV